MKKKRNIEDIILYTLFGGYMAFIIFSMIKNNL